SRHAGDLLKLVGEIVTEQSFADAEIARAKSRTLSFIAKSSDDPSSFTDRAHNAFLYSSHPYGAPVAGTKSSVQAIQRKDIIRQYKKFFRPNNSVIAVVGNFDGNVLKEVESAFGKWESFPVESESLPKLEEAKGISLRVVDNPALAQSQIRIGHLGIKRSDEDFLSIRVANTVLGSGFTSRLMDTIRDNMGLTYSISSSFDSRLDRGPFEISTFTRNDMVGKTVKETLKIYKEFWEKGISEKELESTKAYLLGVFPQAIETKEKLAFNLLILRRYGISYDYLKDYGKNVSKMTLSEVNESIRKHFHPDNLKVTIYGPASKVVSQVRSVGVVETRNFKEFQ
ncbi:MAG: insulinase family protein, partial [Bdellovibrionales bacterium]|nr:insulinase family protein [Bdellovibrionales bacterium]